MRFGRSAAVRLWNGIHARRDEFRNLRVFVRGRYVSLDGSRALRLREAQPFAGERRVLVRLRHAGGELGARVMTRYSDIPGLDGTCAVPRGVGPACHIERYEWEAALTSG